MAREIQRAADAPNDGARRLRELLRRQTAAQLAKRIGYDPTAVRRWASGKRTPQAAAREVLQDRLAIPSAAWETGPAEDAAATTKARPEE